MAAEIPVTGTPYAAPLKLRPATDPRRLRPTGRGTIELTPAPRIPWLLIAGIAVIIGLFIFAPRDRR